MSTKPSFIPRFLRGKSGRKKEVSELFADITPYNEGIQAQKFTVINKTRISYFTDDVLEENGGVVNADRRTIDTGSNSNGRVRIKTKERSSYQAGATGEWGWFHDIDTDLTGNHVVEIKTSDDQNGIGWRFTSGETEVFTVANGTETTIPQSDWNTDVMDGSGNRFTNPSGLQFNPNGRDIVYIRGVWYGAGPYEWVVLKDRNDGTREYIVVHQINLDDTQDILDTKQPIVIEAKNNGETTPIQMKVRGRQFSIISGSEKEFPVPINDRQVRYTVETTDWEPIMMIRKKPEWPDTGINNTINAAMRNIDTITNNPVEVRMTFDDDYTEGSPSFTWENPSMWGNEVGTEVMKDTAALASATITPKYEIFYDLFETQSKNTSNQNNINEKQDIEQKLGDETVITIWLKKVASGDTNPIVTSIVEWKEDQG